MANSLYDQFFENKELYPDNLACRFENSTYTYAHLDQAILECQQRLLTLEIEKGDVIAVSLPNCLQSIELFYAINALGAISYNIHPLTPASQMKTLMERANAKMLFTLILYASSMKKEIKDKPVIAINPYHGVNLIKEIAVSKMAKLDKDIPLLHKIEKADHTIISHPSEKEDAVYLNTGGTNGDPKIVRLSNDAINYLARQGYDLIGGKREAIKILTAIPLFHGFGLTMGVHTPLSIGSSTTLMLKFNTKEAIHYIQKGQATVILGVPALYNALLSKPAFYGPHLKKQIVAYVGGDSTPQSLIERWDKAMKDNGSNGRLFEGYGLTETVTCCNVNTFNKEKPGSIGKPLPGIEEKIVDLDTGEEIHDGRPGEILVSGPTLMNGYLNEENLNKDILKTDENGKIWLSTKDYGSIDSDGYLFFKQRLRRIVKINGESLCPRDVEEAICSLDFISESYCYGVKDEKRGHCFRLAVSLTKENKEKDPFEFERKIYEQIKNSLMPSYLPDRIDFYDELPHTPVGKIDTTKFTED